jgi:hypothetical protein
MPLFETEFSLMPAIMRLEQRDARLSSIDLRGKGKRQQKLRADGDTMIKELPSPLIEKFALALMHYDRPQLKSLALHNHFLDPVELPLMFDALRFVPSLDSLILFHHDLGDHGVNLLMQALSSCSQKTTPLKELYLSHCSITCTGAKAIADALNKSSRTEDCSDDISCKLACLQVLSLGSNQIKLEGAFCLARAFAKYPPLHRLVLHGNRDILDEMTDESKKHIFYQAIKPAGWQRKSLQSQRTTSLATTSNPTTIALAVLSPLILPHIQRRWEKDRVLIRPYEELRRQLKHELYNKRDSRLMDSESKLKLMPDVLAYIARKEMCHKQTSLSSHFVNLNVNANGNAKCHSGGCEICPACTCTGLNDVYELLHHMPHILCLLRNTV